MQREEPQAHHDPHAAARDVALEGVARADELAAELWERILEAMPETAGWAPVLLEAGPSAAAAIVRELATHLDQGTASRHMHAAALGLAYARQLAREDMPLAALLRMYQVGHEVWRDFYVALLSRRTATATDLVEAAGYVSAVTFAYLNAATQEVVQAYEEERERVGLSGERARRQTLAAVLAGESVDPATVTVRLGLDLRRSHTALVAWTTQEAGGELAPGALEDLLGAAAALVGVERPLVATPSVTTAFAWLTRSPDPGGPRLDQLLAAAALPTGAVAVTCGREAPGVEGFRTSHQEALAARRFVTPGAGASHLVTYDAVELLSLLAEEPARAGRFLRRELGGLAAADPAATRLRGTLAVFLGAGSSATRAAELLGVHKNTVTYRVRQAERVRGVPLDHRRLELEAALRLAEALPASLEP